MSVWIDPEGVRTTALGIKVSKAYTIATETANLFTVSGGVVLITSLVGEVMTAMTVANTVKLVSNPTVGTASDLCAATDLGTTDTPVGNLISITGAPAVAPVSGIGAAAMFASCHGLLIAEGALQQVTTGAGADGAITWTITYVPVDTGAYVSAA